MNNGIHYYDQLKSNLTQGIPMLLSSLETVTNNAVLLQLIFLSYHCSHQQSGIFFLQKKKKRGASVFIERGKGNKGHPLAYSDDLYFSSF